MSAVVKERTHPAVMVAGGSQGTYPLSSHVHVPDWTSCPAHHSWGSAITLAAGATEDVNVTHLVSPGGYGVYAASANTSPMNFAGYWGYNNRQHLVIPFGIDVPVPFVGGNEHSPGITSPPFQPNWKDPFGQIFHSATWHQGAR